MFNQWCTIESDPAVFSELITRIGVPDVQVEQVYSLDDKDYIEKLKPIYGLIFLFKWTKDPEPRPTLTDYDKDLFYAKQVINNACATQAILAVLLNAPVKIEGTLKDFQQFTKELSSEDKGLALSNSEQIRLIHNSFSRPEPFIFKEDKKKKKKEEEAFHFVSYVPFKGVLYELDGLQKGPINLGTFEGEDWISLAEVEVQKRILKYSEKEIRFTLLAVCQKLSTKALNQISNLEQKKLQTLIQLSKLDNTLPELKDLEALKVKHPSAVEVESSDTKQTLLQKLKDLQSEISMQEMAVHEEDEKTELQRKQNVRRKHNYIPLILQMLKTCASKGKLTELLQEHQKQQATKKASKKEQAPS